jgi:hypothetical protein
MNKMRGGAWFLARGPRGWAPIPHVRLATQQSFNLLFEAVSQSASPQILHGMNIYSASVHFATRDDADLTGADR